MVFSKALVSSCLFIALLSFAEVNYAFPTPTSISALSEERSCINFCFAIDGSTSISSREFDRQLFLATAITRNVPSSLNPGFAAVQYGISTTPITPLTKSPFELISAVRSTIQQEAEGTFITGGLNYCFSQLFDIVNDSPICPTSVIVLMGNGVESIGSDPAERSGLFEAEGGDVITVGFGPQIDEEGLTNIGGKNGFFNANRRSIRNLAGEILRRFGIEVVFDTDAVSS